jgi:phage tail protein X
MACRRPCFEESGGDFIDPACKSLDDIVVDTACLHGFGQTLDALSEVGQPGPGLGDGQDVF